MRLLLLIVTALGLGAFAWIDEGSIFRQARPDALVDLFALHRNTSTPVPRTDSMAREAGPRATAHQEAASPHTSGDVRAKSKSVAEQREVQPLNKLDPATLTVIAERPLFSPTRRPPVAKSKPVKIAPKVTRAAPAPKRPKSHVVLVGVVAANKERVALLRDQRTGAHRRGKLGDTIDGWRVAHIGASAVELSQAQWKVRLELFDQRD